MLIIQNKINYIKIEWRQQRVLNVDLRAFMTCMVISLSTDSGKNNESVKKWGTSDFWWRLVTFQGYSPPGQWKFGLTSTPAENKVNPNYWTFKAHLIDEMFLV